MFTKTSPSFIEFEWKTKKFFNDTFNGSVKGRWIRPKTLTVYKLKLRHCTLKKKTLQNKEHIVKGECSAKNPNILWFIVDNECYILRYRWSILWSMFDKEIGCHGLILRNSKWNQKYHLLKLSWQNWIENCGDEQNLLLMKLTNVFISFFNWKKKLNSMFMIFYLKRVCW